MGILHRDTLIRPHKLSLCRGARALVTRGRAPPVQVSMRIISADISVVDRKAGAKWSCRNRTAQYRYVYPQNYESHTVIIHEFAVSDLHCATVWSQSRPGRL